ncbi:MAG: thiamine pyrophosphate-binding protein [Rhodospirillaceae bacterium]
MSRPGSNQLSGSEAMARMLQAHGVRHVFGLCGDTSLPFYDALARLDHGMTHILTRDERHAGYMADAYARVTNRPGVCEGPSGGGATYLAPGLVEAGESSIPVLAITSDVSVGANGHYPLTELDQDALFRPLTKWNGVITTAPQLPAMVRGAFRAMTTGRPGSAHLALPYDVQRAAVPANEIWAQDDFHTFPAWPAAPAPVAVDALMWGLLAAKNPLVICGGGAVISGAEAELQRLAERLNLPVATTISGQGALSDMHANCLGVVGSNGGVMETRAVVEEADFILFISCRAGSVTTERWRFPAPGARIGHIDSDPMVISANYATEFPVVGDARLALAALNAALDADGVDNVDFGGAARVKAARDAKFGAFEDLAASDAVPIRPERIVAALNAVLPDDAVLIADPGTPCPYLSAYYRIDRTGRQFFSNRAHGALGFSLAAAVGAQVGRPDAKVVAMMGDGSFGMAVGELETVVRLGLPITYVVVSNAVFGWIKAGQKSAFDARYFSVDFNRTDHAAVAQAFGVKAYTVIDPAALQPTLAQAVKHNGPTLVDVIAQPFHEARAPVSEWIA